MSNKKLMARIKKAVASPQLTQYHLELRQVANSISIYKPQYISIPVEDITDVEFAKHTICFVTKYVSVSLWRTTKKNNTAITHTTLFKQTKTETV